MLKQSKIVFFFFCILEIVEIEFKIKLQSILFGSFPKCPQNMTFHILHSLIKMIM